MLTDLNTLQPLIAQTLNAANMSGLVVAVAQGYQPPQLLAYGTDAAEQPLQPDSLFIVASITKLATALCVLRLVDHGDLGLDDELGRWLPHAAAAQTDVTIRAMLCHAAGLPVDVPTAWAPYALGLNWGTLAEACLRTPIQQPAWQRVQYGNLGYGLLALVVERISGLPFSQALDQFVLQPLGVEAYLSAELPRPAAVISDVRGGRAQPGIEPFNSAFYRSLALPWAGLITTAHGALTLVRAFHGYPAGFLSPWLLAEATANQTGDLGGGSIEPLIWDRCPWGLGPELRGTKTPHWSPNNASPDSFGHAGASGTLAWYDPKHDVAYAIFGSRTAANGWLLRSGVTLAHALLDLSR